MPIFFLRYQRGIVTDRYYRFSIVRFFKFDTISIPLEYRYRCRILIVSHTPGASMQCLAETDGRNEPNEAFMAQPVVITILAGKRSLPAMLLCVHS